MSTNYTRNYNLCQWEASDKVLRTDFNADNAKIDAALGSHAAQIAQALTTAGNAFSPSKLPVAVGQYTGDGTAKRTIDVGFRPRAVLVIDTLFLWRDTGGGTEGWHSGVALDGSPAAWTSKTPVMVTENGFQVGYVKNTNGSNQGVDILTNEEKRKFVYLAFR